MSDLTAMKTELLSQPIVYDTVDYTYIAVDKRPQKALVCIERAFERVKARGIGFCRNNKEADTSH